MVLLAGPSVKVTLDGLALFNCKHVLEVEHCLFPVSVLCVWAGREPDGLVACGKLDIEPRNDGVDEVAAAGLQLVWKIEGKVSDGAGVQVECDDWGWVSHDGLDVDSVDEGLGHGSFLERSVVETPDVVPDCSLESVSANKMTG